MINVMTAKDFSELRQALFKNFLEVQRLQEVVEKRIVDETSSGATSSDGGMAISGGTLIFEDYGARIYVDEEGNLTFEDANAGAITLSQIAAMIAILWRNGSAYGIKSANNAGTEKYFGLNGTSDGWNIYDSPTDSE